MVWVVVVSPNTVVAPPVVVVAVAPSVWKYSQQHQMSEEIHDGRRWALLWKVTEVSLVCSQLLIANYFFDEIRSDSPGHFEEFYTTSWYA